MDKVVCEKGDIVLFRLDLSNWRAWLRPWAVLIAFIQDNPITHSAIIVEEEFQVICEAYYPRTRITLLRNVLEGCYTFEIVRPVGSTSKQRKAAALEALKYTDSRYDWKSLIQIAKWYILERLLGFKVRNLSIIHESSKKFFCQELVTQVYKDSGFDIAELLGFKDPSAITPKDLDPEKSKYFKLIDSSNPMIRLEI
jgi:hypothetical protein